MPDINPRSQSQLGQSQLGQSQLGQSRVIHDMEPMREPRSLSEIGFFSPSGRPAFQPYAGALAKVLLLAAFASCAAKRDIGLSVVSANPEIHPGPLPTTKEALQDPAIAALGSARIEKHVLQGNPIYGEVTYYGQFHLSQDPARGGFEHELYDLNAIRGVARYQAEIAKDLARTGPAMVFDEGAAASISHEILSRTEGPKLAKLFPGNLIPDALNDAQSEYLAVKGAAHFYVATTPGTRLRATMTIGQAREVTRQVHLLAGQNRESYTVAQWNLLTSYREQAAAESIAQHLNKNKGDKVALVYGGGHHFGLEDFSGSPPNLIPSMKTVTWPGIYAQALLTSTDQATERVIELASDQQAQVEAVRRATSLRAKCYPHLRSETAQLLALEKLFFDPRFWESRNGFGGDTPGGLRDMLVHYALSDAVREKITGIMDDTVKVVRKSGSPTSQELLIDRARGLYPGAFRFFTGETNQLKGLQKLAGEPNNWPGGHPALKQYLLDFAETEAVRSKISELFP